MATPNIDLSAFMPITYTGSISSGGQSEFKIGGSTVSRPECPLEGSVLVTVVAPTKGRPKLMADGGGYSYQSITECSGSPGNWRGSYTIVVPKRTTVRAYFYYFGSESYAEDVGKPVSITFTSLGELKN